MRQDVPRVRVLLDHVIALGHELLEADAVLMTTIRKQSQLEPALVMRVDRIEERLRLSDVNQHRDVQPDAGVPDRIEFRVVDAQPAAIGFSVEHAEILEDLQPQRAGLDVLLELPGRFHAEAGADRLAEVHVREQHHPVFVLAAADRLESLAQAVARVSTQVDEQAEVVRVHPLHDLVELVGRHRNGLMAVNIDHRKLRTRGQVLGGDQRRFRFVVSDAGRRPYRSPPLPRARANLSGLLRPHRGGGQQEHQERVFHDLKDRSEP